jgi:hypothetical protein
MSGRSEDPRESPSAPVVAGLAAAEKLEADEVPDSMIGILLADHAVLLGHHRGRGRRLRRGAAVRGRQVRPRSGRRRRCRRGPGRRAVLPPGRREGRELAIGRLYDPSGGNELAPLDDFGRRDLGALNIEFRAEGGWQAA